MADPCPVCGLPDSRHAAHGEPCCIMSGGDRCYRRGFERVSALLGTAEGQLQSARALLERARLQLANSRDAIDLALEALEVE